MKMTEYLWELNAGRLRAKFLKNDIVSYKLDTSLKKVDKFHRNWFAKELADKNEVDPFFGIFPHNALLERDNFCKTLLPSIFSGAVRLNFGIKIVIPS